MGASALVGCGSNKPYQRPLLAREIESIRAPNGLFFLPQLRADSRVDAYDNGWGLAALRASGALDAAVTVTPAQRAQLLAGVADSPLWNRYYLTLIDRAVPSAALIGAADLAAVAALYRTDGHFADPTGGSATDGAGVVAADAAAVVANTAAAIEVLRDGGADAMLGDHRAKLAATLLRYLARTDQTPYTASLAVTALSKLGQRLPPGAATQVGAAASRWIGQVEAAVTAGAAVDRRDLAYNAYGLAQLRISPGLLVKAPPAVLVKALTEAAAEDTLSDYQLSYYLAVAVGQFARRNKASKAVTGLLARRLPSGLLRPNDQLTGSVQATFYAEQVLLASGVSPESEVTTTALTRTYDPAADPAGQGQWFYAYSQAGGNDPPGSVDAALARIPRLPPTSVSAQSALDWASVAELMTTLGVSVPMPIIQPWPVHDAESAYRAAQVMVQLSRAGLPAQLGWVTAGRLVEALEAPAIANSAYRSLVLFRALQLLNSPRAAAALPPLRARVSAAVGCPGLPYLLRDNAHDPECDLRTTAFALALPEFAGLKAPLS